VWAILQASPARSKSATVREAIRGLDRDLRRGDVLLIAGKGHETGQIIGKTGATIQRP